MWSSMKNLSKFETETYVAFYQEDLGNLQNVSSWLKKNYFKKILMKLLNER